MLLVTRPPCPSDFRINAPRWTAEIAQIAAHRPPRSDEFSPIWCDYKDLFAKAQDGRCGYCDARPGATGYGEVEHFRPKAGIKTLLHNHRVTERAHSPKFTNRGAEVFSERGYHWLAYDWDNYVFSCKLCNTYKGNLFPVREDPRPSPPAPGLETALLLSCYGIERPSKHIEFKKDGSVEARNDSEFGRETIATVGLYRHGLASERKDIASRVYQAIDELEEAKQAKDFAAESKALQDLLTLGCKDRVFAGVARAIVEAETDLDWASFCLLTN